MKIQITKKFSKTTKLVVIPLPEAKLSKNISKLLPNEIQKDFTKLVNANNFKTKANKTYKFDCVYEKKQLNILVISTGKKANQSDELFRNIGNTISKHLNKDNAGNITITSESLSEKNAASIVEGLLLGNYKFDKYITEDDRKAHQLKTINFLQSKHTKKLKELLTETEELCTSTILIRDLVNSPSIDITPSALANTAKKIAKQNSKIKATILGEKEIKKNKMGLIQGVSSGSNQESKVIILEYKNKPKNKKPIMVVGKGVTFDAGGLNLKIHSSIEGMKMDMAGGATVLGLFNLIAKLKPELHIIGIVPAVENLVGGDAYKPDDILTAYNGKTVEITNTDAEGRLILADSLAYGVKKFKPECIIDLATLTGACITALGYTRAGLFSNDTKLRNKLTKASKESGSKTWPLPIDDYHRDKVKGDVSDYKNYTGGIGAGSTMAAAFLEKFVDKTPWAHLDIAGVAFIPTEMGYRPKGATGEPLKLLHEFLKQY